MEVLDNITNTVKHDLKKSIKRNSKISIAAACFSMYAYKELRVELNRVREVNFIFTSPTFIKENIAREQKEFYIPRLSREKNLYVKYSI